MEAVGVGPCKGASAEREEMEGVGTRGKESTENCTVGARKLGCCEGNVDLGVAEVVARAMDAFPPTGVFVEVCHSSLGDGLLDVRRKGEKGDPLVNGAAGGACSTGTVLYVLESGGVNNSGVGCGGVAD